jgi:molybdenum cofactor cytidylyltransferase
MIGAIVLAAGESRRMGRQKVLLPYGDSTILGVILDAIAESTIAETAVVTGHQPERVREAVSSHPVRVAHNPDYAEGMLSSVRVGLRGLGENLSGILLFLGDQPRVDATLIDAIIKNFSPGQGNIIVPTFQGRRGHPLLLDASYADSVLHDFDDVGLRGLLQRHPEKVQELAWNDEGVLIDLDTPEEYAAATGDDDSPDE